MNVSPYSGVEVQGRTATCLASVLVVLFFIIIRCFHVQYQLGLPSLRPSRCSLQELGLSYLASRLLKHYSKYRSILLSNMTE